MARPGRRVVVGKATRAPTRSGVTKAKQSGADMTAHVISLRQYKANRIAIAKGERIRELAEELGSAALTKSARWKLAVEYWHMGWARWSELRLALEALEEAEGG